MDSEYSRQKIKVNICDLINKEPGKVQEFKKELNGSNQSFSGFKNCRSKKYYKSMISAHSTTLFNFHKVIFYDYLHLLILSQHSKADK